MAVPLCLPKVVGVLSALILCLGLSHPVGAQNEAMIGLLKTDHFAPRQGGQDPGEKHMNAMARGESKGGKTIKDDVLLVEDANCFVRGRESTEGRLRLDKTTLRVRNIDPGDRRVAKVKDQNYVLQR